MNRRFEIIKHTISQKRLGGSISHWFLNCFCPTCETLAQRYIVEMTEIDEYIKIKLKNQSHFLYFNKAISFHSLCQAIAEQSYEWQWHYYQIEQTKVEKTDVVLDCGAAEGIFCYLNHTIANCIYAFEPLPEYIGGLHKTFDTIPNVKIIESALGDKCGSAYLKKAGIASMITSEKTDTTVAVTTVDHFCETNNIKISYLKADIEGYEINLLQGAIETIKKFRPKIAITTYHEANHADEIKKLLLNIHPSYNILTKGIEERKGSPVMLHAW